MGAVEARLGDDWFEIPAVDTMMQGKAAKTWLVATRNLKAAHPKRNSFDRATVLAAMEAIQDRNATAMAMANLLVEDWSGTRIDHIESTMFQGAFVKASKDPAPVSDGFGRSIPGPDEQPAAKTAKTSSKPKRNSTVTFEE